MITVIIANYKYKHLLSQCIDSVISQTRKPDRILVIDDNSEDISDVCNKYGVEYIIRKDNLGTVENFRQAFNEVTTDKVMFLGADNWLRLDALELMDKEDADIVSSDISLCGTELDTFRQALNTEYKDGYHIWRFKEGNIEKGNYIHGSSLYNVEIAKKVGGYERNKDSKNTEEDWMLWRKMLRAGAKHKHIKEPLLYYRRHEDNFIKI